MMTLALTIVMTGAAAMQLAERPLAGVLKHPAIGYYTQADARSGRRSGSSHRGRHAAARVRRKVRLSAAGAGGAAPPVESQMLVMSKTGVQGLYTGPANPRAIFFNDAVTVGYIRGAPLLELAVQDPEQGVVFYTVDQKPQARPIFERRPACLSCHQAYSTLHVPGMLARSVFMAPDGLPLSQFGSYDADDRTPFRRRWGGWYVTGADGGIRHIGNAVVTDTREARDDRLRRHAASHLRRSAVRRARLPVRAQRHRGADGLPAPGPHDQPHHPRRMGIPSRRLRSAIRSADGPVRDAVGELVDDLLFVDEDPLPAAIAARQGLPRRSPRKARPIDHGRSLRQLDLEHRLLRYPCSYMIYSAAFAALPARCAGRDLRADVAGAVGPRHEPEIHAAVRRGSPQRDRDPARDAPRSAGRVALKSEGAGTITSSSVFGAAGRHRRLAHESRAAGD